MWRVGWGVVRRRSACWASVWGSSTLCLLQMNISFIFRTDANIPEALAEEMEQETGLKGEGGRRRWLQRMRKVLRMAELVLYQLGECWRWNWNLEMELLLQQKWVVLQDHLQVLG